MPMPVEHRYKQAGFWVYDKQPPAYAQEVFIGAKEKYLFMRMLMRFNPYGIMLVRVGYFATKLLSLRDMTHAR